MYARYSHLAGATAANVLADITALVTGETNVANLSGSCDKGNSYILNTASSATWTVHDAAASATSVVYKAPFSDDPTKFHYVQVTVTATTLLVNGFEAWNATSHIGTNPSIPSWYTVNTTYMHSTIALTSASAIHFSVSPYHISLFPMSSSVPQFFGERSRRTVWDTVANGYPTGVSIFHSGTGVSRLHLNNGTDATNQTVMNWSPFFSSTWDTVPYSGWVGGHNYTSGISCSGFAGTAMYSPDSFYPDASKSRTHALIPFGIIGSLTNATKGFLGGELSSKTDMWLTTWNYGTSFDEMTSGADTYIIWAVGQARLAIRKG